MAHIEIGSDFILIHSKNNTGKIKMSEIEQVSETANHFFVQYVSGFSFLIPKTDIATDEELRLMFKRFSIVLVEDSN